MAQIMVAVMPFAGHLSPLRAIITELIAHGHLVRVYTGSAYSQTVREAGAEWVPWVEAPDFDEHDLTATFGMLRGRKGPRQTLANLEHIFVRTGDGQFRDLMKAWSHKPWDLLLADSLSTGAALVAEVTGCAWASVSVTPLAMPSRSLPPSGLALAPGEGRLNRVRNAALRALFRTLTTGVHHAYNQTRAAVGLPATRIRLDTGWFSRELICVIGIPELDYPRADLPPQVHYVGAVRSAVAGSQQFPEWWNDVVAETRPIVHVTQGTQDLNPNDLLRPALSALSGRNVLVVASTGIRDRNELPFPVPANARVWGLLPYAQLLPRTRLMVTNGGWGAALDALSHGIPLVVAGGDIDKPEIAARLAYSGVAIDLRTGTPTAAQIDTAVDEILSDARYAERAGVISSQLAVLDGAAETRRLVENLIGQRARSS